MTYPKDELIRYRLERAEEALMGADVMSRHGALENLHKPPVLCLFLRRPSLRELLKS